jgi:hypothetical protein
LRCTQPSPKTRRAGPGYPRGLSLARISSVCHGYYHNLPPKSLFRPQNSLFGSEIRCLGGSCEPAGLLGGSGWPSQPRPTGQGSAFSQPSRPRWPSPPDPSRSLPDPSRSLLASHKLKRKESMLADKLNAWRDVLKKKTKIMDEYDDYLLTPPLDAGTVTNLVIWWGHHRGQ